LEGGRKEGRKEGVEGTSTVGRNCGGEWGRRREALMQEYSKYRVGVGALYEYCRMMVMMTMVVTL